MGSVPKKSEKMGSVPKEVGECPQGGAGFGRRGQIKTVSLPLLRVPVIMKKLQAGFIEEMKI